MRMPGYPQGVPSQYAVHYHPWPTRFHGPLYQRPVFRFPWMAQPQNVLMPWQFQGLGADGASGVVGALFVSGLVVGAAYLAYQMGFESGAEFGYHRGAQR